MTTLLAPGALPALPLEIMEEIIHLLAPHKALLLSCSLVSRSWRSRALHHLFHSVAIRDQYILDTLVALLAANPALATHIYEIRLFNDAPDLSTLPTLRHVEELCLYFVQDATFKSVIGLARATFPRVRRLTLGHSVFCSRLDDVCTSLFTAFPHISQLLLASNRFSLSTTPPGGLAFAAGKLRTLKLFNEDSAVLDHFADPRLYSPSLLEEVEYLQRQVLPPGVFNGIDDLYAGYANGLSSLLNAATSLRRVRIVTQYTQEMETLLKRVTQCVNFSADAALRVVTLECHFPRSEPAALPGLLGLIRAICRPTMSAYAITLSICSIDDNFEQHVPDALGISPPPDETPVELVLKVNDNVYMIPYLATLEGVLRELTRM